MLQSFGMEPTHKRSDNVITIASVALFILAAFGVIVFLYNQNQSLKKQLIEYKTVNTSSPTSNPTQTPDLTLKEDSSVSASPTIKATAKPIATSSATVN